MPDEELDEPMPRIAWYRRRAAPAPRWLREARRMWQEDEDA